MNRRITKWDEFNVGDLIECRADGVMKTLLVCEKVELDKDASKKDPYREPLRLAVLYAGKDRYTLFENDLVSHDGVFRVWKGEDLKKRLDELEV